VRKRRKIERKIKFTMGFHDGFRYEESWAASLKNGAFDGRREIYCRPVRRRMEASVYNIGKMTPSSGSGSVFDYATSSIDSPGGSPSLLL
jgi:hypothetical protein